MNKSKKQKERFVSSIKKTQRKTNIMLANARKNSLYEKVKAMRPLFLKIIRMYDYLKDDLEWDKFWYVAYKKSCEFIKEIDRHDEMNYFGIELTVKELNYINIFKNNCKKMKKMCQDSSIIYYSMLPDNIPIDVRTYCIQFISHATIHNF
jgi:hypothetical protein